MTEKLEKNNNDLDFKEIEKTGFTRFMNYLDANQNNIDSKDMMKLIKLIKINSFSDILFFHKMSDKSEIAKFMAFKAMIIYSFEIIDALMKKGEQNERFLLEFSKSKIQELGFGDIIFKDGETEKNLDEKIISYIIYCFQDLGAKDVVKKIGTETIELFAS